MGLRRALWLVCLTCLPLAAVPAASDPALAERLWDLGQEAMRRGQPADAVRCYQRSLAADPGLTRNHLSLAAAHLEMGDEAGAAAHLARYVAAHPEQLLMRLHLADLLLRLERSSESRTEFERCVCRAQEHTDPGGRQLIHCHTRLMEIAEHDADSYAEHLHRGIGLFHLALQRVELHEDEDQLTPEALLCKAAGELTIAQLERPDEARPAWYLHEVWSRLAQRRPALRSLQAAQAAAPFTYLTAAEQRGLRLACDCTHLEKRAK